MIEGQFDPNDPHRWRVRIEQKPWDLAMNFYVWRSVPPNVEILTVKDNQHVVIRLQEGATTQSITPTFQFGGIDAKAMMAALAEALEDEGIKTPNDFKIQGLLEATKAHLADMRQLLKLK